MRPVHRQRRLARPGRPPMTSTWTASSEDSAACIQARSSASCVVRPAKCATQAGSWRGTTRGGRAGRAVSSGRDRPGALGGLASLGGRGGRSRGPRARAGPPGGRAGWPPGAGGAAAGSRPAVAGARPGPAVRVCRGPGRGRQAGARPALVPPAAAPAGWAGAAASRKLVSAGPGAARPRSPARMPACRSRSSRPGSTPSSSTSRRRVRW